jgi:tRNA-specific 2-thiouridylase
MIDGNFIQTSERSGSVLLAMSGGVDSATSAVLLQRAGLRVTGITMKNYCYGGDDVPARSCCSLEAIDDARGVCDRLGISHTVADTGDIFGREVYDNFLSEYRQARTPNPCVRCNSVVRFDTLIDHADRLGIDFVATGHYARLFRSAAGRLYLARSRHPAKDQSYFLSASSPGYLERVLFPLGDLRKSAVRETAHDAGLGVAEKPESQDVCFIPDGELREFLDGKIALVPGNIEDSDGNVLGRHAGLGMYTVGQRRGMGISAPDPLYVVRLDAGRNVLVVGTDGDLFESRLTCRLAWIDGSQVEAGGLTAQVRSRSAAADVVSVEIAGDKATVEFESPQRAIAPGQTIAFYRGDIVVGSGVIESSGGAA